MSESWESGLSKRLRRLPGQLLLALVNGTAILVIAAAVLAIVASSKVTHLAQNVASTMTDAVLSRVDGSPRQVIQSLQGFSDEVHTLVTALQQAKVDGLTRLDPEIARLNERLGALEANIKQLRDARSHLVDEAIARVASSLSEGLQNLRTCPHGDVQTVHPAAN
jgi:hypothetical protein